MVASEKRTKNMYLGIFFPMFSAKAARVTPLIFATAVLKMKALKAVAVIYSAVC